TCWRLTAWRRPSVCVDSTPKQPSPVLPVAVINDRAADRLRGGHPWVYDSDILGWEPAPPLTTATDGDGAAPVARLRSRRAQELGLADYSPQSKIRLRLLSRELEAKADRAFFRERLARALAYRAQVVRASDAYRAISAEGDGLPGLIVDRYGDTLAFQTLTWAMAARQPMLLELLDELLQPSVVVERNDVKVRELEGLKQSS